MCSLRLRCGDLRPQGGAPHCRPGGRVRSHRHLRWQITRIPGLICADPRISCLSRRCDDGFGSKRENGSSAMPNLDETDPPGNGPCTRRGLAPCGREEDKARSAEDPSWDEGSGRHGRPVGGGRRWAFGPGRKPADDSARPGATARQQESFCSGHIAGLAMAELDRLKGTLSECLHRNAKDEE